MRWSLAGKNQSQRKHCGCVIQPLHTVPAENTGVAVGNSLCSADLPTEGKILGAQLGASIARREQLHLKADS